jgi:hypothetical protein
MAPWPLTETDSKGKWCAWGSVYHQCGPKAYEVVYPWVTRGRREYHGVGHTKPWKLIGLIAFD